MQINCDYSFKFYMQSKAVELYDIMNGTWEGSNLFTGSKHTMHSTW